MQNIYHSEGAQRWEGFVPVSIKMLRSNTSANFDIYLPMRGVKEPVLFHKATTPITEEMRRSFLEREGRVLLIREEDKSGYQRYIEENLSAILSDPAMPVRERASIMYDTAQAAMKELLESPDVSDMVKRTGNLVKHMIGFQQREVWAFRCLLHVASFDYSVYTHSLNVFTFATSLAMRLGFSGEDLQEISNGALLHDMGKSQIDPTVLNFPGKLNDAQWIEMKKHPVYGYERLKSENCCSEIALNIVRHHHEKVNGVGYPDGLSGDEIPPWVRISTIADIFDALTTRRVYKDAVKSFPALKTMHDEMSDQIDRDMFALFVRIMGDQADEVQVVQTRKRLYDLV